MRSNGGVPGFTLGKVRGIEIRIDWSLALVFFLITFNLGAGLFPLQHPDWSPLMSWALALLAAVLFFGSVLAHELSHALVAKRLGIPVHGITLFIFGGLARIAGEPPNARAEFLMAIVGPLTSLVIGVAATTIGIWLAGVEGAAPLTSFEALAQLGPVSSLLLWLGPINVLLGLFNLVPGFPLDGGRVLRALLWHASGDVVKATRWASAAGRIVALALVFTGMLMIFGHEVPIFGRGLFQGLWFILIGWFLYNAALVSHQHVVVREQLRGVPVARLMREPPVTVSPDWTLEELANHFLLTAGDQRCLPVARDGRLLGTVCVSDLRKVPRDEWPLRTVQHIMTPADGAAVATPNEQLDSALAKLGATDLDQLPVVEEGGRLRGILRRADVLRWLELQTA